MHFEKESAEVSRLLSELLSLHPSAVLLLEGELGAGKTTFAKELLARFAYNAEKVQSPTFLKMLEYEVAGLGRVVHMDCYRMNVSSELEALGLEAYSDVRLWLIEWPQLFTEYLRERPWLQQVMNLPREALKLSISASHEIQLSQTQFI